MPLLDTAISQPCSCFRSNIIAFRSGAHFHNKLVVGNDRGLGFASSFSWKPFCITEKLGRNSNFDKVEVWRGGLTINAAVTLEIAGVTHKSEGMKGNSNVLRADVGSLRSNSLACEPQSSSEDSTKVNEREKLRRMRISKAKKGSTPWNKGRKHKPETLQRIEERTRLAMQDPKVKTKLLNLGHAQSEETRTKIGVGVRLGWERRRGRLMLQETCLYEWQDLIAEAAQKGLSSEEDLRWDSYKTLDRQLEQEWLQNVEEIKNTPRQMGSRRASKSADHRRKISEAISAKWADPEYRNRVCSSIAKFHGISEEIERKPRRKPSGDGHTRIRSHTKKDEINNLAKRETKSQNRHIRLKRSKAPPYKDPFASSKLEMLKNIRAQRAAAVNQESEAISRAKLLIAKAEKATEALEIAAKNSPHVQTSLTESRMLIAEAIQFVESVENEENPVPFQNDDHLSENSTGPLPHVKQETDPNTHTLDFLNHNKVNGDHIKTEDFSFNKVVLPHLNGRVSNSCHDDKTEQELHQTSSNSLVMNLDDPEPIQNESTEFSSENAEAQKEHVKIIKKWVRGQLVEVVGDA